MHIKLARETTTGTDITGTPTRDSGCGRCIIENPNCIYVRHFQTYLQNFD